MSFSLTGNEKAINGYACKEAVIELYDNEAYNVWFTDEFDYSWSFDNFLSIVPGTVIQASLDDKVVFELLGIYVPNDEDIIFSEEQISLIMNLF
jgi:GLPGLI family protein